jgi:hypothetical protein
MSVSLATRPMHRDGALTHTAYARTHGDDDTPPPRSLPSLPHAREGETERMRRVAKTTINEREFHQTEGLKEATARLCVCEGCAMRHRDTRARAHVPLSLTHSQTLTQRHSHRDTHTETLTHIHKESNRGQQVSALSFGAAASSALGLTAIYGCGAKPTTAPV